MHESITCTHIKRILIDTIQSSYGHFAFLNQYADLLHFNPCITTLICQLFLSTSTQAHKTAVMGRSHAVTTESPQFPGLHKSSLQFLFEDKQDTRIRW